MYNFEVIFEEVFGFRGEDIFPFFFFNFFICDTTLVTLPDVSYNETNELIIVHDADWLTVWVGNFEIDQRLCCIKPM